jgi:hypothetical protein
MRRTGIDPKRAAGPSCRRDQGVDKQALRLILRAATDGLLQADQGRAENRSQFRRPH